MQGKSLSHRNQIVNRNSKVYVAGHTGLVGGALIRKLKALRYENLLRRTHSQLDLTSQSKVDRFFQKEKPEYVFLAAAKVGGILANYTDRVAFLLENLKIQNNVISSAYRNNVKKLLFLGSSCIYPKNCPQPIKESYLLTSPLEYTNEPYAIAKIAGLKLCESYNLQYGTDFIAVMPANLYGPEDNYDLNRSHVIPALIKKCFIAKLISGNKIKRAMRVAGVLDQKSLNQFLMNYKISKEYITVWGTGKPRREFLYSDDLAEACVFIMKKWNFNDCVDHHDEVRNTHLNIGYGTDISIKELAQVIKDIVGFKGEIRFDTSKPDGTFQKLLDSNKLSKLGWKPKIELEQGIRRTIAEEYFS